MAGNKTPRNQRKQFQVTVGGMATSEDTRQLLGLPIDPPEPVAYKIKPVTDDDFIESYQNAFLQPERVKAIQATIDLKGIGNQDDKVAVGTAISERQDFTRIYLQKTKDRKPAPTQTMSAEQLLEYALDPLQWAKDIWWLDRDLCKLQENILKTKRNTIVLAARQIFGKTTAIATWVCHQMSFRKVLKVLIATNQETSAINFVKIIKLAFSKSEGARPNLDIVKDNEKEFELSNGSICKALSSGSAAPRGFTADILILDEAAYISDKRFEEELYPTTKAVENPIIIASTTPNGKQGWFYKMFVESDWSKHISIDTDCTWKEAGWIEATKKEMTETAYRQEFKCEFLEIENAVFSHDQVEEAFDENVETWKL